MAGDARDAVDGLLRQVVERLPRHGRALSGLFEHSEAFRTLCEEYLLCAAAVERWRDSEAPVAVARRREYDETLVELEREIEEWLESAERGAGRSSDAQGVER